MAMVSGLDRVRPATYDDAGPELPSVEQGENVAELLVQQCAILERKRAEAAQQGSLLLAISGDLDPALASGNHA